MAARWPEPPAHLSARELDLWQRLGRECGPWVAASDWLTVNAVVSLMDRVLLIQAAQRATKDASHPLTIMFTPSADGEPNAEPAANPLYGMELKFWTALRGYIALLGLSPADRARMPQSGAVDAANPLDKFIQRGRR